MNELKIGIITFHNAWNSGAVLQCYALKSYLQKLGHKVVIINYCPIYNKEKYKKYPNLFYSAKKELKKSEVIKFSQMVKAIAYVLRDFYNYRPTSSRLKKKKFFDDFLEKNFETTILYETIEELRNNPPKLDVYISGSDQVWNPKLTNEIIDEAYFCDFGRSDIKRIGYAISACQLDTIVEKDKLEKLVKQFNYLSLREKEKKDALEKIYGKKIEICLDPTFLLKANNYAALEEKCLDIKEEYILVYAFDYKELRAILFELCKKIEMLTDKSIKVIYGPRKWPYKVDIHYPFNCISPGMFLTYIKNADVVITNSFHATTFSIIYEKEFYSLVVPNRGSRVVELLSNLGLQNRIVVKNEDIPDSMRDKIDYKEVRKKLEQMKEKSGHYLCNAIYSSESDGRMDAKRR